MGRRVKLARSQLKPRLTQAELAAKLQLDRWDIDRAGVAKIEIGIRQVTDIELLKLASALNVTAAWLLGEAANRKQHAE
ncbi:MAG: hypothetical protein FOGNACKC_02912 [Anaerolineae bacterium]|nr:hypothetical protein [Anaerolineae bacterium]